LEDHEPTTEKERAGPGAPQAVEPSEPDYMKDKNIAYLAYILRETELLRNRVEKTSRQLSVLIALMTVGIIVFIVYWLDITGTLSFF